MDSPAPFTLHLATDTGLLVASFADGELRAWVELAGEEILCSIATGNGGCLAGTRGGLRLKEDGAWLTAHPDLGEVPVTALAVGAESPVSGRPVVWAGTEPSAVYLSHDGGRSWRSCSDLTDLPSAGEWSYPPDPDTHHVRALLPHPRDPLRLLAGIEAGAVIRTGDGGKSWRDRTDDGPRDAHDLKSDPGRPDRVFAAAGDGWMVSDDFGGSWTRPGAPERAYLWSMAMAGRDPRTLLVSAAHGAGAAHEPGKADAHLYRRRGSGWEHLDPARSGPVFDDRRIPTVAALPGTDAGFVVAAQDTAVALTRDGGEHWRHLDPLWPDDAGAPRPGGARHVRVEPVRPGRSPDPSPG